LVILLGAGAGAYLFFRVPPIPPGPVPQTPVLPKPPVTAPEQKPTEPPVKPEQAVTEERKKAEAAQAEAKKAGAEEYAALLFAQGQEQFQKAGSLTGEKRFEEARASYRDAEAAFKKAVAAARQTAEENEKLNEARNAMIKARGEAETALAAEKAKAAFEQAKGVTAQADATPDRVEAAKLYAQASELFAQAVKECAPTGTAKEHAEQTAQQATAAEAPKYAAELFAAAEALMTQANAATDAAQADDLFRQAAGKYDESIRTAVAQKAAQPALDLQAVQASRAAAEAARVRITDQERLYAAEETAMGDAAWAAAEAAQQDPPRAKASYDEAANAYLKALEAAPGRKQAAAQTPKAGETRTFAGIEFVWCAPGTFTMGSPAEEKGRSDDEKQHAVTLTKGFWIGKYEVTQAQWEAVIPINPSAFRGPNLPVDSVTWDDTQTFISKLNMNAGGGFRLPTETEWEFACRAGSVTPFSFGAVISTEQANCDGNYTYNGGSPGVLRNTTLAVGSLKLNAWGLFDMHGNVCEWCQDWYGPYPDGPVVDPAGPPSGAFHDFRGGCWSYDPQYCRSAFRDQYTVDLPPNVFGFRLAR